MPIAQTHCLARAHAPATPPYRETAMMQPARHQRLNRRQFLGSTAFLLGGTSAVKGDSPPPVTQPRATSGDSVEPNWEQRLTVSVGPHKADLIGADDKVIQAAVDYVTRLGGGTVHILPGTYRLRNAVYLQSRLRILGSGADSILQKEPSLTTKPSADSVWYIQDITMGR